MLDTIRFLKHVVDHPLNSDNKFGSILRWVRWQLGSRIVQGAVVVDFVNDAKLLVKPGMRGATENIYTGLYDFKDMSFLLHLLREDDLFVDIGANVGTYTILASSCCKSESISIEPIQDTFRSLTNNIQVNDLLKKVTLLNIGIGSEESVLRFTNSLDCINHVLSEAEDSYPDTVEIKVRKLDDVLENRKPILLKIDVEGFESQVIAGANKTLESENLLGVIMELNDSGSRYGYDDSLIHQTMIRYGFNSFDYDPFHRQLIDSSGKDFTARNTLYLKNTEAITQRLSSAPQFRVLGRDI
jgi:FkbM family methyltransferase